MDEIHKPGTVKEPTQPLLEYSSDKEKDMGGDSTQSSSKHYFNDGGSDGFFNGGYHHVLCDVKAESRVAVELLKHQKHDVEKPETEVRINNKEICDLKHHVTKEICEFRHATEKQFFDIEKRCIEKERDEAKQKFEDAKDFKVLCILEKIATKLGA